MALLPQDHRIPTAWKLARRPCAARVDVYLKACAAIAACGFLCSTSHGATLLASQEISRAPVPVAPPTLSFGASSAAGRQGPLTGQPLGASSAAIAPPVAPQPATSQPAAERRAPAVRKHTETTERASTAESGGARRRRGTTTEREPEVVEHHPRVAETNPAPAPEPDYKSIPAQVTTARSPWSVDFGWGWYNNYYFRGLNILNAVSSERVHTGVFTARASIGYSRKDDAFTAGFSYWQAFERQTPKGAEFNVPPNSTNKSGAKFALPAKDRYAEYNLYLGYTRSFWDGKIQGSFRYDRYNFSNGEFYKAGTGRAIPYADETTLRFDYLGFKYIQPSVSWSHDYDGFIGDFFELRLEGTVPVPANTRLPFEVHPYASLSYDMDYNGSDNGWNSVEFGVNVPVHLTDFLTLNLTANYVQQLEDSEGSPRARSGFWGGAMLSAKWGPQMADRPVSDKTSKKVVLAETELKPWEFSIGAGWRQFNYGFDHARSEAIPVDSLYSRRTTTGALGFSSGGRIAYDNGVLGPVDPATGLANAFVQNAGFVDKSFPQGQYIGNPGANGYARFSTTTYAYDNTGRDMPGSSSDQDSNISPYVQLDRELWRKGPWSFRAGLGYEFGASAGDSGYRLNRLDTLTENRTRNGYDYSLDNYNIAVQLQSRQSAYLGTVVPVVVDPVAYANAFGVPVLRQLTPIYESDRTSAIVAQVGTFVRSTMDVSSHDLALPFSLRYDFGNRLHAELTIAPTVTIVDSELTTDIEAREFSDLPTFETHVIKSSNIPSVRIPIVFNRFGSGLSPVPSGINATFVPPPTPAPTVTSQVSGKGALPKAPDRPGTVVARRSLNNSSLDALFGVETSASLLFDLNTEGSVYAELWGRYHWVQGMTVSNGFGESTLDLSGFQAGIGLGFRF